MEPFSVSSSESQTRFERLQKASHDQHGRRRMLFASARPRAAGPPLFSFAPGISQKFTARLLWKTNAVHLPRTFQRDPSSLRTPYRNARGKWCRRFQRPSFNGSAESRARTFHSPIRYLRRKLRRFTMEDNFSLIMQERFFSRIQRRYTGPEA